MANRHVGNKSAETAKTKKEPRPDCYHDPGRLLRTYRDVRWSLKLSEEQHRLEFEEEYGMSISEYLDDFNAAGVDFTGTKLEHRAKSMKRTAEMLKLIDAAVHLIRENNAEGEIFYWILYYSYLSPNKLSGVAEIIDRIQMYIPYITRDIYFRHRRKAIAVFSSVLWGFTTRGDMGVLDVFITEGAIISGPDD